MYPPVFTYHRPATLAEALALRADLEDAAWLSGGHTLLPAMKNRLAAPTHLIDLRAIPDLHGLTVENDHLRIGAATPHAVVAASDIVRKAIPALAGVAGSIADPQVRNQGTIGGSVANNDPSADYPTAVLGLGGAVVTNLRHITADAFFTGLFSTALEDGEVILRIDLPLPDIAGYAKLCSQASRYAMAGSFVSRRGEKVRVAITGSGGDGVFRWTEAEAALAADFSVAALAGLAPDPASMASDMHGDADYRAALVAEMTRQAVAHPGAAFIR
jgi:carbon-monoxide dehydrogenase medium subunit